MKLSKLAVAALIPGYGNKYLAITRKDNTGLYSMPGGKVELCETKDRALVREVLEETNLDITSFAVPFYEDMEGVYFTTTYLCKPTSSFLDIETEPGVYYEWLTREELSSPLMSPFWEYNTKMFEAYEKFTGVVA